MENKTVKTSDGIEIALNHYKKGGEKVVIIAPGWCMTKDSDAFIQIAQSFAQDFDVISFDFRGHGESKGFYTFTAKEILDIDAITKYAKDFGYKSIYLAGFSLGAAVSLIYSVQNEDIEKIIAVSAPSDFDKIENAMWKKAAWGETFKKFELNRFLSIRPDIIPKKKIKPIDIVDKITVPTLFVAGEKDPTVYAWHTEKLYEKAVCKKAFKLFENGYHAEDLYLCYKEDFMATCLNWLN